MAIPLLSDLLTIPTQDTVFAQEIQPELTKRGVRVTDWLVGGAYRAIAYVVANMRVDVRTALAALAAAGFEDYAFGVSTLPSGIDVTGWAPLIAKQRYGVTQIAATYTLRNFTITNTSGNVYSLTAGQVIGAMVASGNRYVLNQAVTVPANGSVAGIQFRSEFPYSSTSTYNGDASGSTIQIVTAQYPGVTLTNPAPSPSFSPVTQTGAGTGSVTPSGSPSFSHTVAVKIDVGGNLGVAQWSTSLDNAAYVSQGTSSSVTLSPSGGGSIVVTLADASPLAPPSFVAGTVYYFSTPGSDLVQAGRATETPQQLGTRCRGLWPSLAFQRDTLGNPLPLGPTQSAYQALALSASTQVTTAYVATDGTVNNKVNIILAGQGAPVPTGTVATVQAFFNSIATLTDNVLVSTTSARTITLAGLTLYCKAAQVSAAQTALTLAIQAYLGGTDARNVLGVNGTVEHGYLNALARFTPGVTKITDGALTINSVAADYSMPGTPGAFEQAVLPNGFSAATAFTWIPV